MLKHFFTHWFDEQDKKFMVLTTLCSFVLPSFVFLPMGLVLETFLVSLFLSFVLSFAYFLAAFDSYKLHKKLAPLKLRFVREYIQSSDENMHPCVVLYKKDEPTNNFSYYYLYVRTDQKEPILTLCYDHKEKVFSNSHFSKKIAVFSSHEELDELIEQMKQKVIGDNIITVSDEMKDDITIRSEELLCKINETLSRYNLSSELAHTLQYTMKNDIQKAMQLYHSFGNPKKEYNVVTTSEILSLLEDKLDKIIDSKELELQQKMEHLKKSIQMRYQHKEEIV